MSRKTILPFPVVARGPRPHLESAVPKARVPRPRGDSLAPSRGVSAAYGYEEAELDELTRTSLSSSVEELIENHHSFLAKERAKAEAEEKARALSLDERRKREEQAEERRLRVALERGRALSFQRREQAARQEAARAAAQVVQETARHNESSLAKKADVLRQERILAKSRLSAKKGQLRSWLQAALILGAVGTLSMTSLFHEYKGEHVGELEALRTQAALVEQQAQAKEAALHERLAHSVALSESERTRLRAELAAAQERALAARAQSERLKQGSSGHAALSRTLRTNKPSPPTTLPETKAAVATTTPQLEPAVGCLEGDPLCWEL